MRADLWHGCCVSLAQSDFATVAWLIVVAVALTATILVLAHLIGPRRTGPVKNAIYESGMEPFTDARRQFNVRFYLIAVLFLVFDVEVVFLYPWAVLYPRWHADESRAWVQTLEAGGYSPAYLLAAMGVFFSLLLVGFVYEWRRGVFKWN